MAGGGSRRDDGPLKIGSTNGFAVLDSLKKKKKSDKDSKSKGSSKRHEKEAEPPVFWNPKPLVNKSWADVEDEDDDDYYATSAPPQGIWGSSESANQKKEIEAVIEEESESEDEGLDEGDEEIEEEQGPEPEAPISADEPAEKKMVPTTSAPKDTERQLSKKELKKKGLEELDALLAELGISGKDGNQEQSKEGKKSEEQNGEGEGEGGKKDSAPAASESKTSKKKKSKKDKSSREAKDLQEQQQPNGGQHANNGTEGAEDGASGVDVKERLKKAFSLSHAFFFFIFFQLIKRTYSSLFNIPAPPNTSSLQEIVDTVPDYKDHLILDSCPNCKKRRRKKKKMGFWSLFLVASTPSIQVLLIGLLGAYLASGYSNILTTSTRKDMNKVVFAVFTPSLMFVNLAKSVTLEDIISWWFMPINIAITFLVGGVLGWIVVKILKPERHLEGLITATCSAGNLGNLLLIIVPAVCNEKGNPFGDHSICSTASFSYVSFSMALGGFFIWTHSFSLIKKDSKIYHKVHPSNGISDINEKDQTIVPLLSEGDLSENKPSFWGKLKGTLHQIIEELMAPPTVAAFIGFFVGAISPLKSLIIGDNAPLRVIQDSIQLLGDGTLPCITLIMGGNLTQGFRKSLLRPMVIISIICVRFVILPIVGIGVVKAAYELGFLPHDPLYRYVLMIQFTVPPAMGIGTMAQLFDVGQDECSVIFLWTYLAAALSLTVWSTVFVSILS